MNRRSITGFTGLNRKRCFRTRIFHIIKGEFNPNSFVMVKVLYILAVTMLIFSCQKEYSCEGCTETSLLAPIAAAGPDQEIDLPLDSVMLDGSGSNDPDGVIREWLWSKISGPASFLFSGTSSPGTTVKNLTAGVYEFALRVRDDDGLSSADTLVIRVRDPFQPNRPPVANAGPDLTIFLPVSSGYLDGSSSFDPDHNITDYLWRGLSGPASFSIGNPGTAVTQVTSLVQGVYEFELQVTDAGGLSSKDTVHITVSPVQPPCADCRIAFVSRRDGNPEIYVSTADGATIRRLTYSGGTDEWPAWSPDGTKIAFSSDRSGATEIYVMEADGSNVTRTNFKGWSPAWSPDGTKILFTAVHNGSSGIWLGNVSSGQATLFFDRPGWEDYPAWSPDGSKITLVSDYIGYDLVWDIYTINSDGSGFTALTGNLFDQRDYLVPRWSPDGTKISLLIQWVSTINEVGLMNTDGSGLITLRSDAAPGGSRCWSNDVAKIVYTSLFGSRRDDSWVSANGTAWGTIIEDGWNADFQR